MSSTKSEILKVLEESPDTFISGAELGRKLNISRNAIWKAVKALESEGYIIESVTNKGYRLSASSDVINSERLEKLITSCQCKVVTYKSIASTNNTAKDMAAAGAPEGTIVIADMQTAGKGRMGRSFYSPERSGLYMSVILRPAILPSQALLITTAAAATVAEVLSVHTSDIWIKWVNDIFYENRKVCGILTEAVFNAETAGLDYAILGIGINIRTPEASFPDDIKNIAGALDIKDLTRTELAAAIINRFFDYYHNLPDVRFLSPYKKYMKLIDKEVSILPGPTASSSRIGLVGDSRYSDYEKGVVTGITDDFHLLVRLKNGQTKELSSGEIAINP